MASTHSMAGAGGWIASLFLVVFSITGCVGQSNPRGTPAPEARVFVGNTNGTVSVIEHRDAANTLAASIDLFSSVGDMASSTRNHLFVNLGSTNQTAALDPIGASATFKKFIQVGQRPVHIYRESPDGTRIWVLNDSDSKTGVDTVTPACNTAQAGSVSVIQNHDEGGDETGNAGAVLATICVGKGHHKAAFSVPGAAGSPAETVPIRAFVSSIKDGTITVIDNDPASTNYLKVISTINLCDQSKEPATTPPTVCPAVPNSAGPHGMFYSPVSGKIYNNNETYGTVNVINPSFDPAAPSSAIEQTFDLGAGLAGATYLSPDGRFIIVRGAQSNASGVTGKLTVIDVTNNSRTTVDLPNVNPADLVFTSDGKTLYIPSAGSATPAAGQKSNVVLVFDSTALPALTPTAEIAVGATAAGRALGILEHGGAATEVFVTNRADGTVSVIDAGTNAVVDTLQIGGTPTSLLVFPMEENLAH